jgi:hypothetical protein
VEVAEYLGRKAIFLRGAAAMLKDFELQDGVIDVDVASPATRAFFGLEFRANPAERSAEWIYLRPHKSGLPDALQYTPVLGGGLIWQFFNGPGFTGPLEIPRNAWFHLRLEVAGAQAKLYVNDMGQPCLIMSDLKSGNHKGSVSLVNLTGPVYFANFQVRETPPGNWDRKPPPMPANTLTTWSLSQAWDAETRDPERPLSSAESAGTDWQQVTAEPPGFIVVNRYRPAPQVNVTFADDFSKRLEPQKGAKVVYARTTIGSDRAEVRRLYLGYSDEVSVFLNGSILFRGRSAQNFRDPGFLGIVSPENDSIYLPLRKGRNELLLAVTELGGGWGFTCRLGAPVAPALHRRRTVK